MTQAQRCFLCTAIEDSKCQTPGHIHNSHLWMFPCVVSKCTWVPQKVLRHSANPVCMASGTNRIACFYLILEGHCLRQRHWVDASMTLSLDLALQTGRTDAAGGLQGCWWGFLLANRGSGLDLVKEKKSWHFYLFILVFVFFLPIISIGAAWEKKCRDFFLKMIFFFPPRNLINQRPFSR